MKWFQTPCHSQTNDVNTKLHASGIAMLQKQKPNNWNDIRNIEDTTSIQWHATENVDKLVTYKRCDADHQPREENQESTRTQKFAILANQPLKVLMCPLHEINKKFEK